MADTSAEAFWTQSKVGVWEIDSFAVPGRIPGVFKLALPYATERPERNRSCVSLDGYCLRGSRLAICLLV